MSDEHDVKKEVRGYILVFVTLAILTVVTVGIKYLHLIGVLSIIVALIIATVKAGLVACYFMHLISEKKLIYGILIATIFFFLAMVILLIGSHHGIPGGAHYVS